MTDVTEQGADVLRELGRAASRNPISAALIGVGALWLFSGRGTAAAVGSGLASGFGQAMDRVGDIAEGFGGAARSGVGSAADAVHGGAARAGDAFGSAFDRTGRFGREQVDTLADTIRSMPSEAAATMSTLRSDVTDLFNRQPLALGLIGAAIGAGIAAAFPPTATEAEYLGATSDAVKDRAKDLVSDTAENLENAAERAMHAASEEAERQGLTIEGATSAVSGLGAKAEHVLDAAKQGAAEKIKAADPTR